MSITSRRESLLFYSNIMDIFIVRKVVIFFYLIFLLLLPGLSIARLVAEEVKPSTPQKKKTLLYPVPARWKNFFSGIICGK
ncbi:hypothetical protein ACFL35_11870 [Candidatus Riflebacteria bacterium]